MQKIPSLFIRDYEGDRKVTNKVTPGCEWVINGEGIATRKYDGTCCLIQNGVLYKRYEVKKGKTPPTDFKPATEVDPFTGKQQGWVPVGDGKEDRWHRQAFHDDLTDGTYELCGPKVQGNPENFEGHVLLPHGKIVLINEPRRDFKAIAHYLASNMIEGIVYHHPDGRMVKIKKKDF
ncbi:MAG: DUF5565 family protein [Microcoleus sp.]